VGAKVLRRRRRRSRRMRRAGIGCKLTLLCGLLFCLCAPSVVVVVVVVVTTTLGYMVAR
jgi:hypothetical protein